jgi:hypothetical protein
MGEGLVAVLSHLLKTASHRLSARRRVTEGATPMDMTPETMTNEELLAYRHTRKTPRSEIAAVRRELERRMYEFDRRCKAKLRKLAAAESRDGSPRFRPQFDNPYMQERDAERKLLHRTVDIGYKVLAKELHPDKLSGDKTAMTRLNRVRDKAKHSI